MKRTLKILFPLFLFAGMLTGIYQLLKPRVKTWALQQARALIEQQTPYTLDLEDFSINFLSPGLSVHGLSLKSRQDNVNDPQLLVEEVKVSLDFIQLLGGRLWVSSLIIRQPEFFFIVPPSKEPMPFPPKIDSALIFSWLKKIPISRVVILDLKGRISVEKNLTLSIQDLRLLADLQKDRLRLELLTEETRVLWNEKEIPFSLGLTATARENLLHIQSLEVGALKSRVKLQAQFNKWDLGSPSLTFESALDLSGIRPLLATLPLQGQISLNLGADFKDLKPVSGSGVLRAQKVFIDNYEVGNVFSPLEIRSSSLFLPKLDVTHPSGRASLTDTDLGFQLSPLKITVKSFVESPNLDLQKLLQSIHVNAGVDLTVNAGLKCGGDLVPDLHVKCSGKVTSDGLEVRVHSDPLVQVGALAAQGDMEITTKEVKYNAELQVGGGRGASKGTISYRDGFSIDYNTSEMIDFAAVKKLSKFKLEGKSFLNGHTEGNASTATFWIDFDGQDLFFENFSLGKAKGKVRYRSNELIFENVEGKLGASQYQSNFSIDLLKEQIQASAQLTRFQAGDVLKAIDRFLPFTFDVTGLGNAQVRLWGPLVPEKLSYQVNAALEKGTVFGDSFDRLDFRISSDAGRLQADQVRLRKRNSLITLQGQAFPTGELDFFVRGEQLGLEDSENVSRIGANISGALDFGLNITGFLRDPEFSLKANLSDLIVEDQEFADSSLAMQINNRRAEGRLSLFEQRLSGEFRIPFNNDSPMKISAMASNWDYSVLFSLIGGARMVSEYNTSLSGTVNIASESGGFSKASGNIQISQFLLQRSNLSLSNNSVLEMNFKEGRFEPKNFSLSGPQAEVRLRGSPSTWDNLNLELKGQMPLRLVHFLFPFLEELSGDSEINVRLGGAITKPEILGQADVRKAHARLRNFPHPVEKVDAHLEFSKSLIFIPKITGQFAGGPLHGEGQVKISGPRNIPVDVSFEVEGASLNFPEKMQTNGNIEMSLTGSWFPFLLSGSYNIQKGFVEKEFTDANSSGTTVKASSYIPKILLRDAVDPIHLDIDVQLAKPVRVKNSLADAQVAGEINVSGSPANFGLLGEIRFEKGSKILVSDRVFDLSAGNVKFVDPSQLNPELFFQGRTRVADYDINLLVQGLSKDPQIRFNSSPPLPDKEIISLLALGMTSSTLEKSQQSKETDNNTSYRLGSAILSANPVTKKLQENLGVELDITSSYDDKKNVSTRRFTMSRRVSKNLKVSASRQQTEQSSTEFKAEYSLTPQLSAVAAWENREPRETRSVTEDAKSESIFGLDLDFRREFR